MHSRISLDRLMNPDPRLTLITAAHLFYQQGWMAGTAGSLSARLADGSFWITVRGCAKYDLTPSDFIRVAPDGTIFQRYHPEDKPSSETLIHEAIYSTFPQAQACYHIHSIESNLVARFTKEDQLLLPPLEMVKGLGVSEEHPQVMMPIFANHLRIAHIAADISTRFETQPPAIPALLIRDHGVTVWSHLLDDALNYVEIVEYVFRYMVAARQLGLEVIP